MAVRDRSKRGDVTGKLAVALGLMVWNGYHREAAAAAAGMADHSVREALRKPHVRAWFTAQLDVLRTGERARNIHALAAIRDASGNANARVAAVRTLEQMSETGSRERPSAPFAGLVVNIVQRGAIAAPAITIEGEAANDGSIVP